MDVPIVVARPPSSDAAFNGIKVLEDAIAPRCAKAANIGIIKTSTGVLLMNIENENAIRSETSNPSCRFILNILSRKRAAGSSAPVTTNPLPITISAQIVISAG